MADSATATIIVTQIDANNFRYSVTLDNTGATGIATFWFAWDDVPDTNFMTTAPSAIQAPANWFAFSTHNGPGDGYGIQFYTPFSGSDLAGGATLSGFSFQSTEAPAAMFAPSPIEPAFSTLSSFVYPVWPPTVGDPQGANLVVACFHAGTRILTARGEVPVEHLRVGDLVATLRHGGLAPVLWLGHRQLDCRRHRRPDDVWPVRVHRDAFGPGCPARDLLLSPDHAVYLAQENALVPIRHLINGASIAQNPAAAADYWHVELPAHDVVLAEGLPAESYLDTGNRAAFANGGTTARMDADFSLGVWARRACAPLVVAGPPLAAAKQRLLDQARALGHLRTTDPCLHVVADGARIDGEATANGLRFEVPPGAGRIRLRSRHVVAGHLQAASTDHRRIGVGVARLAVDGVDIPAGDRRRAEGWHLPEAGWQWTDGDATLLCPGARRIDIELGPRAEYWSRLHPEWMAASVPEEGFQAADRAAGHAAGIRL